MQNGFWGFLGTRQFTTVAAVCLITLIMPGCFKKESLKYMTYFKAVAETGADIRENG